MSSLRTPTKTNPGLRQGSAAQNRGGGKARTMEPHKQSKVKATEQTRIKALQVQPNPSEGIKGSSEKELLESFNNMVLFFFC